VTTKTLLLINETKRRLLRTKDVEIRITQQEVFGGCYLVKKRVLNSSTLFPLTHFLHFSVRPKLSNQLGLFSQAGIPLTKLKKRIKRIFKLHQKTTECDQNKIEFQKSSAV